MKKRHRPLSHKDMIKQHLKVLKSLQKKSGLFTASIPTSGMDYDKAWLRDNFYECIAFEVLDDWETVRQTYRAILDIFEKHKEKIEYAIAKKPEYTHEYIHARYHPENFDEYWEEWGNKQNDSVGCILFKIGELEVLKKIKILESKEDYDTVQRLVDYLSTLEFWHDSDSGMWEEWEEIHASSIGACIAGLEMAKKIKGIHVSDEIIKKGKAALNKLLPRESSDKFVDLSQLSLIWPYNVTNKKQTKEILENVEYHLRRKMGVIRYKGDRYYNKNLDSISEEAEWTFGFSWLAIIYAKLGNKKKAKEFLESSISTITKKGEIPELYYSNTNNPNPNTPLGWSESLFITALYEVNKNHIKASSFFGILKNKFRRY